MTHYLVYSYRLTGETLLRFARADVHAQQDDVRQALQAQHGRGVDCCLHLRSATDRDLHTPTVGLAPTRQTVASSWDTVIARLRK